MITNKPKNSNRLFTEYYQLSKENFYAGKGVWCCFAPFVFSAQYYFTFDCFYHINNCCDDKRVAHAKDAYRSVSWKYLLKCKGSVSFQSLIFQLRWLRQQKMERWITSIKRERWIYRLVLLLVSSQSIIHSQVESAKESSSRDISSQEGVWSACMLACLRRSISTNGHVWQKWGHAVKWKGKEEHHTTGQGASSPSRPGKPGSPFSPLKPRKPCLWNQPFKASFQLLEQRSVFSPLLLGSRVSTALRWVTLGDSGWLGPSVLNMRVIRTAQTGTGLIEMTVMPNDEQMIQSGDVSFEGLTIRILIEGFWT